jgi:hypothetical protein
MADLVLQKSIAELIDEKLLLAPLAIVSGAGQNNVAQNGIVIDRMSFPGANGGLVGGSGGSLPRSLDVVIAYTTTLGAAFTLAFTLDVQDSADGVTFTDLPNSQQAATVVATGAGTFAGVMRMVPAPPSVDKPPGMPGIYIGNARRFIRLVTTGNLNRGATDTATFTAIGVFGGFDFLPSPQT